MTTLETLAKEIEQIKERNKRVELDKNHNTFSTDAVERGLS